MSLRDIEYRARSLALPSCSSASGIMKTRTAGTSASSRRRFLKNGIMASRAFAGLQRAAFAASSAQRVDAVLEADQARIFDLPEGFSYQAFSRVGETMDDGLLVPGKHDGEKLQALFVNIMSPGMSLAITGPR